MGVANSSPKSSLIPLFLLKSVSKVRSGSTRKREEVLKNDEKAVEPNSNRVSIARLQMLNIIHKSTSVKLDPKSARSFQAQLQGRYNSLLSGVRLEYARRLGLEDADIVPDPVNENGVVELGEIFLTQPGTICFVRYDGSQGRLEASAISNSKEVDLGSFFSDVKSCLESSGARAQDWEAKGKDSFIPEDAEPASTDVSEKELEAARELMNAKSRKLLEQLAGQESILVREIDSTGVKDLFSALQHFEELELIRKDYAVIDQKTGQQILRVPSRASLEEASQKFFIGGTAISNDNVDEVISCTPFCRALLANDQWLLLLLLGTLSSLELGPDAVYVCRSESGPSRVYLQTSQQCFLIVLSNRRLTLDDGYLVGAQVAAYQLKDIIVVSTDRTSTLMRHHLQQSNESGNFAFVDSLSDLEASLRTILVERQRAYLREVLDPLADLTPVKVQELIVKKMVPDRAAAAPAQEGSYQEPPELDEYEEEDAEEASPARLLADSFEAPAPGVLPAFGGNQDGEPRLTPESSNAIQIDIPAEEDDMSSPPITEPEDEGAFPSLPSELPISEPPQTEDEGAMGSADDSPSLLPDLPQAEELIPELPVATESARADS